MNIYEMYGRQEERHVQELEELEAKLAAVTTLLRTTFTRLKDGTLKAEDIELTDTTIKIPPPEQSPNGRGSKKAKVPTTT